PAVIARFDEAMCRSIAIARRNAGTSAMTTASAPAADYGPSGDLGHGSALHPQRRERGRVEVCDVSEFGVHAVANARLTTADGQPDIRRGGREADLFVQ